MTLSLIQWLFVSSCLICLGVRATDENIVSVTDSNGNSENVKYEAVGCFADKIDQPRSLRNLYFNARSLIQWSAKLNFTNIIHTCVKKGYEKGYKSVFGIQYYGECWSDGLAEARYNMYGGSSNCAYGVGKDWANMVYRISVVPKSPVSQQTCNISGKEYSEGAQMMIPNDWSRIVSNAQCMKCVCSAGQAKDCKTYYYCETGIWSYCSRWKNSTGCCPVCDCYHDGKVMMPGSTWPVRQGDFCSECTCGFNYDQIATCTRAKACVCSEGYDPVPVPGKCCPKCVPKSTTTTPTTPPVTIPQTTTRPPPTFPPFPMP